MGRRRQRIGRVVSDKMQKTIVVVEERLVEHPLYHKYIRRRTKYYVHDENQQARVGDLVRIEETRPLSKLKRWRLVEIVRRGE
jgi:small subunit ribosomal protein S17